MKHHELLKTISGKIQRKERPERGLVIARSPNQSDPSDQSPKSNSSVHPQTQCGFSMDYDVRSRRFSSGHERVLAMSALVSPARRAWSTP